jgi:hypothetical protein
MLTLRVHAVCVRVCAQAGSGSGEEAAAAGGAQSCCGLPPVWDALYAAPGYGVYLTLLVGAWAVLLAAVAASLARALLGAKHAHGAGAGGEGGGEGGAGSAPEAAEAAGAYSETERMLLWALLVAVAVLLLKLLILAAWWDGSGDSGGSGSGSGSGATCSGAGSAFACAEVRHEVASVWPLTRQSLDLLEAASLALLLGFFAGQAETEGTGRQALYYAMLMRCFALLCIMLNALYYAC